jgi:sorting nexin-5/6/32
MQIPPPPPRPNFDASREKLQRLGEGEGTMTKEEFTKMKQELEAEYLATFKKTVAMHEVFLTRLASHSIFREDSHLHVFLEYDQDLCARPKGKLQQLGGLVKSIGNTTDQYYLNATVRDVNDFFEQQMNSLTEYHNQLKEATSRTDKMTEKHKELADSYIKISGGILQLANNDPGPLDKFLAKVSDTFERARKIESRIASDQDLKLADTLRYYMRDSQAARALLVRRLKCLVNYENANRTLEKARHKNKDIHAAEAAQSQACEQFEAISAQAKEELLDFKTRRLHAFRKSLIELAELEIKHARTQQDLLKKSVQSLRELL